MAINREIRRLQNIKELNISSGDTKATASHSPSSMNMRDGETVFAQEPNKPLSMYKKHKGTLWKSHMSRDGNQFVDKDLEVKNMLNVKGHREEKNQPSFLAFNSSTDANWATGSYANVCFDSEAFDVGSNFASDVFTAPITGKYFLHTSVGIATIDTAATYYALKLVTSNRNYHSILDPNFAADTAAGTPSHLFQITCVADMEVADTAQVQLIQASGTAQSDVMGDSSELYTWFTGYLLG